MKSATKETLKEDLILLGIRPGDLIYLKVSVRSLVPLKHGARTLIDAVLDVIGEHGTIVTSSFIKAYTLRRLKKHKNPHIEPKPVSYAGAVANEILRYPKVKISRHPIQKFAALGKLADTLVGDHDESSYAYDVFRKMAEMGGKTLKIGSDEKVKGVGTTHVAIGLLGFRQKRPDLGVYHLNSEGKPVIFHLNWAGFCQNSFDKFTGIYEKTPGAVLADGLVGGAPARITDMKLTLEAELSTLQRDPRFLLCGDKTCCDCELTWEFSHGKPIRFLLRSFFTFRLSAVNYFIRNYLKGKWQPPADSPAITFMNKSYSNTVKKG